MLDLSKNINLFNGDCLEVMKGIPDGSVDLVLTDPPYGTTACKWDSVIDFDLMWAELKRVIKPNGAIVLFGSEPFSSALRMSNIKNFKYDWVWNKPRGTGFQIVKYKPLNSFENIMVFTGSGERVDYYPQMRERDKPRLSKNQGTTRQMLVSNGKPYEAKKASEKRYPITSLYYSNENQKDKKHPTQKPVPLLEYLIKTYTNESETVLDFTMGSGTTGVACKNLNRKFIGIELDETYFNIAKERIGE